MRIIGVTGGVGAGKSTILEYFTTHYNSRVLVADSIAHMLMTKGKQCYERLGEEFGNDIFDEELNIDRKKLADIIFSSEEDRLKVNSIVHPAVKQYINAEIQKEQALGEIDLLVIEAALLLDDKYEEICDETWYIYSSEDSRRKRLKESRGYTDEKIDGIFNSQMSDETFRKKCKVVIDNDGPVEETYSQIDEKLKGGTQVVETEGLAKQLIFGLDIGTRNVVGTVGYKDDDEVFHVVAQCVREHDTRAMLDGQIHDITKVGKTVNQVKLDLEGQIGQPLTEVCIAAAGRVLKTVTTHVDFEFPEETVVLGEHIHALDLLGIEKAQDILNANNDTKFKFYCVGHTVVKYYLNDDIISNLESHKAEKISEDIIVTFLPEDVVDVLYAAVGIAGLEVLNLTLEPIAAINIAIPETYRMLNIALVDVGAGTSDISITRDGSIIAYGMIPHAGDEITELLVQHYLVDFKTAEHIKLASGDEGPITYQDIMCISHDIESQEVWDLTRETVEKISKEVADKIIELNGDKPVSACFVVGGGGKIHGFTENIAKELGIVSERVALRGEEVLHDVDFMDNNIKKDPLIVTPIGICLSYYEQKNSFIFIHFNGERYKLYNNNKLTIVDAAMEANFPNEWLFPRRGAELNFTVNGKNRMIRGELGESAVIKVDGKVVSLSTQIENNNKIEIEPSSEGAPAKYTIEQLPEYNTNITFNVNGKPITCQRFAEVNGRLESPYYEIQNGDNIVMRNYYTVEQIIEFMDVDVDYEGVIYVNNVSVDIGEKVYENFNVDMTIKGMKEVTEPVEPAINIEKAETTLENQSENIEENQQVEATSVATEETTSETNQGTVSEISPVAKDSIKVTVNGEEVELKGKSEYIFINVLEYISFDVTNAHGRSIVTTINKEECGYHDTIKDGDELEIFWE